MKEERHALTGLSQDESDLVTSRVDVRTATFKNGVAVDGAVKLLVGESLSEQDVAKALGIEVLDVKAARLWNKHRWAKFYGGKP